MTSTPLWLQHYASSSIMQAAALRKQQHYASSEVVLQ